MRWFRKQAVTDPLAVTMSGVKLGDRLLVVNSADIALVVALAGKAGLTGRACTVDESEAARARNAAAIEREGVLVESFAAPFSRLPFDDGAFDVILVRNVLAQGSADAADPIVADVYRALRPGGRCLAIDNAGSGGIAAVLGGGRGTRPGDLVGRFEAGGFRGTRLLAEREGLSFIEAVKPGPGSAEPG